ncbi:uncharacterized protein SP1173 [Hetaerina americana]|uniref:uncharacterized protein SP1173 n=1 Tax=Hetaerina americana TaxID=62018 RepID=UPI003A7F43BE
MACLDTRMVPFKVLLFCIFGALGCLVPFLPLHMRSAGLSAEEARIVSMVAPAVSLLGPLAVGPLADRLASGLWGHSGAKGIPDCGLKDYAGRTKGHRRLRALLAALVLLSALAYCLLLLVVPVVTRRDARTPRVTFQCGASSPSGGVIVQEKCADQCHDWGSEGAGSLVLTDCRYDCEEEDELPEPSRVEGETTTIGTMAMGMGEEGEGEGTTTVQPAAYIGPLEASENESNGEEETEVPTEDEETTTGATTLTPSMVHASARHSSPTHLCFSGEDEAMKLAATCHAFYRPSNSLAINATLDGSLLESSDSLCIYPLSSFNLEGRAYSHLSCRPSAMGRCRVLCSIDQPYNEVNSGPSLLGPSGSCPSLLGNPRLTFWSYLAVRSVADCFPAGALALIDASLLLPSHHASPGPQMVPGALGVALAAPLAATFLALQQGEPSATQLASNYLPYPWPPFATSAVLALVATILLLSFQVPVLLGEGGREEGVKGTKGQATISESPDLYTRKKLRPKLGPYPPTHLWAHACEAAALFLVLVLLGMLWGGLDSYTSWYLSDMMAVNDQIDVQNISTVLNETMGEFTINGWLYHPSPLLPFLLLLGLMMTAAALPAIPLFWYAEKIIEICGHANLLIIAFTFYIVRYSVLSFIDDGWWALISEAVAAPVAMGLAWATAVHYAHLLFPPRLSTTVQAAAVMAHFCIGRCLGAVIGALTWSEIGLKAFLQGGALVAAVVATIYFLTYHCCLKARCIGGGGLRPGGSSAGGPAWGGRAHEAGPEGPTTNGNYTPLRVYHNGRGDARKNRY